MVRMRAFYPPSRLLFLVVGLGLVSAGATGRSRSFVLLLLLCWRHHRGGGRYSSDSEVELDSETVGAPDPPTSCHDR